MALGEVDAGALARAGAENRYFVVVDDVVPLGLVVVVVVELPPVLDGEVAEPEPVVVLVLPGVVVVVVLLVPGDADGGVLPGVLPTRSLSVRLQAAAPASRARAQRPDSIFFISDAPPCGVSSHGERVQRTCPQADLTGSWTFTTTASYSVVARSSATYTRRCAMKLEGSYDVPAPRQKVWDAFFDPEQLRQAIPGCEKLDAIGTDDYKATMKIGVGGVKGTFEGKVRLTEKQPPDSYKMAVEGTGGPGFVRGETVITLSDIAGGTKVSYVADVQVGGLIASVGQRMLGGVSKMMADKFFGKMSELLQAS